MPRIHMSVALHLSVLLLGLTPRATPSPDKPFPKGHLEKFGEAGPRLEVEEVQGFPLPEPFLQDYVLHSKPVKFSRAAQALSAFRLWTDAYLASSPESKHAQVFVEVGKKEDRKGPGDRVTLSSFLDTYNTSQIYLVDEVPLHLRRDLQLPCCLQCPLLAARYMNTAVMWFSSGDTNSVVHTDDYDNINCLLRGQKQLVLIDPNRHKVQLDQTNGSYSSLDVDRVDLHKYPWAGQVEYHHVTLEEGDCFYIPLGWVHQVRSKGSNLAVNFWFERGAPVLKDPSTCLKECDPTWTLDQVPLVSELGRAFLEAWSGDESQSLSDVMQHLVHFRKERLPCQQDKTTVFDASAISKEDLTPLEELDENEDGKLTIEELRAGSDEHWEWAWSQVDSVIDRTHICPMQLHRRMHNGKPVKSPNDNLTPTETQDQPSRAAQSNTDGGADNTQSEESLKENSMERQSDEL